MTRIIFIVSCVLLTISCNEAARILVVIPTPSISHQVVFRPLMLELAKRGHEIIAITTDPLPKEATSGNITEIDLHDISYKGWKQEISKKSTTTTENIDGLFTQMTVFLNVLNAVFEKQMRTKEVQDLIKSNQKFDLLLVEAWVRPALAFAHIFEIPAIFVSSFGNLLLTNEVMGAATHPILYPDIMRQKLNNLSLWDKIVEVYNYYRVNYVVSNSVYNENKSLKRLFGEDFPTYHDLVKYVQLSLINVHPIWENNRPVPPSVVYIGGIHQIPKKELPKDLETYLNSSKNGVIYISFGTNIDPSMLPPERIQTLIKGFSELPFDVLWKFNKDEMPGKSKNIKLSKWLPQSDLLRHPKIKLFITQGGLQSTDEAISAGVPLIGIPMIADQWYNVEQYVHHKIGARLDMETLTKDKFKDTIQMIIGDESYKNNIIRLRSIMYDQPQTALDRSVWWVEHVLRHKGAEHLRSPAANMSWSEYLELELVSVVLLSFIAFVSLIIVILRYLLRLVTRNYVTSIKFKES
ncbi:hypothetical protein K1T71_012520 [Dendrolimus kikuchii]|uniref:Uncharacterized protein n=1 Tax=Dendrolimus kikuchii TaxID=765133 RepID=A0ACC1CJX8_9NEOP|nr:hypothetical protein K1T71_012520 [Dendrolimus kikuchii]